MRHTTALLAGTAVLATFLAGCGSPEGAAPATPPKAVSGVTVATIQRQTVSSTYEATGTVRATLNATLSAKVMSRVAAVNVREGDRIVAGSVLIHLDARELDSAVQIAGAQLNSATVGVGNASTAAKLEAKSSEARIAQAEEAVNQARAGVAAAQSRLDLALAGPRIQERSQAQNAVQMAEANLKLAQTERDRTARLVEAGAVAARQLDLAENALAVAKAQYDSAVQAERIAKEGTRQEDIRAAREAVTQAQAAYRQAQANLRQAKAAAMQVEMRQQEIRSASAQATQARAALSAAQVMRSYATIAAPFDGTVVARRVDPGEMAAPGVPLLSVEGGPLRLEATVPESVLPQIRLGSTAEVTLDALGRNLLGRVVEIVPTGDASTHSFTVKIEIQREDGVKSGMFGRARFVTGESMKLRIPRDATWEREGLRYVFVVNEDGVARLRIVTLGELSDGKVEVLSGLAPGDRIVTGGRESVRDGVKVTS